MSSARIPEQHKIPLFYVSMAGAGRLRYPFVRGCNKFARAIICSDSRRRRRRQRYPIAGRRRYGYTTHGNDDDGDFVVLTHSIM